MRRKTPESYVLHACRDYLIIKGWDVIRMNSGALQDKRGIPVRMHYPGTADLLAIKYGMAYNLHQVVWVEVKAPNGKQSPLQKEFQRLKEAVNQKYILAYGIEDLEKAGL